MPPQNAHALQQAFIALDIHKIGAGQAVLGDEVPLNVREELGGLAFKDGDEFGTNKVTLLCHCKARKKLGLAPTQHSSGGKARPGGISCRGDG